MVAVDRDTEVSAVVVGKRDTDLRAEDVADLMALMRPGSRPDGLKRTKPRSPKTIRNAVGTLNALFVCAQRRRWVPIRTTQRYADYAPGAHEAAVLAAASSRGSNRGSEFEGI